MPIDGKYGRVSLEHANTPIPEPDDMPCFVLLARDHAALPTVAAYYDYAKKFGCPPEGLELIKKAQREFERWRALHRDQLKVGSITMKTEGEKDKGRPTITKNEEERTFRGRH